MFNLPESTEFNIRVPKVKFYSNANISAKDKKVLIDDVEKIVWSNKLSEKTINISAGEVIKEIEVLHVTVKRKQYNAQLLKIIQSAVPYKTVFVIEYAGYVKFALYHTILIESEWIEKGSAALFINGLSFDAVWENLVIQVGNVEIAEGNTLAEQIQQDEERMKILKQIDQLETQARRETNPRKKFELVQKAKSLSQEVKL